MCTVRFESATDIHPPSPAPVSSQSHSAGSVPGAGGQREALSSALRQRVAQEGKQTSKGPATTQRERGGAGEAWHTVGTRSSRSQPRLPGESLRESLLEEVMAGLTLERGGEAGEAE